MSLMSLRGKWESSVALLWRISKVRAARDKAGWANGWSQGPCSHPEEAERDGSHWRKGHTVVVRVAGGAIAVIWVTGGDGLGQGGGNGWIWNMVCGKNQLDLLLEGCGASQGTRNVSHQLPTVRSFVFGNRAKSPLGSGAAVSFSQMLCRS